MKAFTRALIVLSLSIICILNIGLVSAVEQGEISVVPSWSDSTPYQGDTVTVTLRLTSTSSEQLKIYRVGLHFDWMPEGSFFTRDLFDEPVVVPSMGTHIFDLMVIQIPADASAGAHSYFIGIDGAETPYYDSFSWDSSSLTLQILDSGSKVYDTLLLYVAIVAIAVVIAVVIVVAVLKIRKKPDEFSDQPVDEQMETQDYTPEE
jgi:hypothetical protein